MNNKGQCIVIDTSNIDEFVIYIEHKPDHPKPKVQELEHIVLTEGGEEPIPIFILKHLEDVMKLEVIKLIQEYKYVFTWNYIEIPGLDRDVSCRNLNIMPLAILIKQTIRM